jgi:DNA-nicking Smr family endonuclease
MIKRRDLDPSERALWEEIARQVKPACGKRASSAHAQRPVIHDVVKQPSARPARSTKPPAEPRNVLAPLMPGQPMTGVDGGTAKRLRRGRIAPDAVLDLHGLTQDRAYAALLRFVRHGYVAGHRCLLVITGKGSGKATGDRHATRFVMPERSRAGVLRALVPHWVNESELRPIVVGVQSAHQRHGGSGALYLYLRRKREPR